MKEKKDIKDMSCKRLPVCN